MLTDIESSDPLNLAVFSSIAKMEASGSTRTPADRGKGGKGESRGKGGKGGKGDIGDRPAEPARTRERKQADGRIKEANGHLYKVLDPVPTPEQQEKFAAAKLCRNCGDCSDNFNSHREGNCPFTRADGKPWMAGHRPILSIAGARRTGRVFCMNPQIKGQTKEATDKEAIQVKEEVQSSFQPPPPLSPDSANIADPAMADVSQVGDAPPEPPRGGVVMQSAQWAAISGSRAVHNWSAVMEHDDDDWGSDSDDSVQWIRSPPAASARRRGSGRATSRRGRSPRAAVSPAPRAER